MLMACLAFKIFNYKLLFDLKIIIFSLLFYIKKTNIVKTIFPRVAMFCYV